MRKGVSNSEPTAMISAFTAKSVNENLMEQTLIWDAEARFGYSGSSGSP
jgi:hypothetical protein